MGAATLLLILVALTATGLFIIPKAKDPCDVYYENYQQCEVIFPSDTATVIKLKPRNNLLLIAKIHSSYERLEITVMQGRINVFVSENTASLISATSAKVVIANLREYHRFL